VKTLLALVLAFLSATAPVRADVPDPKRDAAFVALIGRAVTNFIRPGYERFANEAELLEIESAELCETPSPAALAATRRQFAALVDAWGRIELIRFGPVAENNRYERIFFWPDRKGISLRQIRRVLRSKDADAVNPESLGRKSVAVQGIGALEYLLHGAGSKSLAGPKGTFRCAYAGAVSRVLHRVATEIRAGWTEGAPFPARFLKPDAGDPVYRAPEEPVQALVLAITQELVDARNVKLRAVLGESADRARPKRAPFRRAGLTVRYLKANITAAHHLFVVAGFMDLLGADDKWLEGSIQFEVGSALRSLDALPGSLDAAVRDTDGRQLLTQATINLTGAIRAIGDYYTDRTGLTLGFNSSDGD